MTGPLLRSDNVAGVSPAILAAIEAAATGDDAPYGDDALTRALPVRIGEIFGATCVAVPVGSGIVGNALALSLACGPLDSALCSWESHIANSEGGAFEFFTGGAKLVGLPCDDAKLDAGRLEAYLGGIDFARSATMVPRVVSLTQATERGLYYRPAEIRAIAAVAHRYKLKVHMDGARFANALAAAGCTPAELSAAVGVDILTLGATKNGAMSAEAIVLFDGSLAATFDQRRRRSGQLVSKMRFMSAQLHAYFADGLWLDNARRANQTALQLSVGLAALPGIALAFPVETNLVFATIEPAVVARLEAADLRFRRRDAKRPADNLFRLVTSFETTPDQIDGILARCRVALA
jgi:threonine aldolase